MVLVYFYQKRMVNGVLMHSASLMGGLALDLGWCHVGETHKCIYTHALTGTHTHTHTDTG